MKRLTLETLTLVMVGLLSLMVTQAVRSKTPPTPQQPAPVRPDFGDVLSFITVSGKIDWRGPIVHTALKAKVYLRNKPEPYLWQVRITPQEDPDTVVYRHLGDPFMVANGEQHTFTLDEFFQTGLPPGDYIARAGIVRWYPDDRLQAAVDSPLFRARTALVTIE